MMERGTNRGSHGSGAKGGEPREPREPGAGSRVYDSVPGKSDTKLDIVSIFLQAASFVFRVGIARTSLN
jgi:hypothetical protein